MQDTGHLHGKHQLLITVEAYFLGRFYFQGNAVPLTPLNGQRNIKWNSNKGGAQIHSDKLGRMHIIKSYSPATFIVQRHTKDILSLMVSVKKWNQYYVTIL